MKIVFEIDELLINYVVFGPSLRDRQIGLGFEFTLHIDLIFRLKEWMRNMKASYNLKGLLLFGRLEMYYVKR
jgi:hypothetical protein